MNKALRFGLVLFVAGLCAASVRVGEADAYTGAPGPVITDPGNLTNLANVLKDPVSAEFVGGSMSDEAASGLTRARMATAVLPALKVVGTLGLAVGAVQVGWAIGSGVDQWVGISDSFTETAPSCTGGTVTPDEFGFYANSAAAGSGSDMPTFTNRWLLRANVACTAGTASGVQIGYNNCAGAVGGAAIEFGTYAAAYVGHGEVLTKNQAFCGGVDSYIVTETEAAMLARVVMRLEPWVSQTADITTTGFTPADPTSWDESDPEPDLARDVLTGLGTAAQVEVAMEIDPSYEGLAPEEFTMPDCEGLTYAACLALLEAEGYVGTVTTNTLGISDAVLAVGGGLVTATNPASGVGAIALDDPVTFDVNPDPLPLEVQASLVNEVGTEYVARLGITGTVTYVDLTAETGNPALGPSMPVRITVPVPGPSTVTVPVPDPGDSPNPQRFDPGEDVTIYLNPPDFPPMEGGGILDCVCPPVDFTPLTSLDYGDNFPFGFFTWVGDVYSDLSGGTATCNYGALPKPGGGSVSLSLCSSAWENTYRAPVFLVGQFCLTLLLIVSLARKALGMSDDD